MRRPARACITQTEAVVKGIRVGKYRLNFNTAPFLSPQNQGSSIADLGVLFAIVVDTQKFEAANHIGSDDERAQAQAARLSLRQHDGAGLVNGPCLDGVPVDLYKCLLLCLKSPSVGDAERTHRSQSFDQCLAYVVKKFLAGVHQTSVVMETLEPHLKVVESALTQHDQSLAFDGLAKPADLTIFLEIIGEPSCYLWCVALHCAVPSHSFSGHDLAAACCTVLCLTMLGVCAVVMRHGMLQFLRFWCCPCLACCAVLCCAVLRSDYLEVLCFAEGLPRMACCPYPAVNAGGMLTCVTACSCPSSEHRLAADQQADSQHSYRQLQIDHVWRPDSPVQPGS